MKFEGSVWKFGDHVDTDLIIPARFLNVSDEEELAKNCFVDLRPDFVEKAQVGDVIVAGKNFGCGSSREHAPWALTDYGFKVIIAPSFADIFFNNSFKNGLLPIALDATTVDRLFEQAVDDRALQLTVDLEAQQIRGAADGPIGFEVDPFSRHCLLNGLDDIGLTLQHVDEIRAYEARRRGVTPWLF